MRTPKSVWILASVVLGATLITIPRMFGEKSASSARITTESDLVPGGQSIVSEVNEIQLASLLVPLSLTSDLGMGFPPEHSMRNCLLAMGVGRELGLSVEDLSDLYYTALLFDIGCTASAHEFAMFVGGDDVGMRGLSAVTDFIDAKQSLAFMKQVGSGLGLGARTLTRMKAMAGGSRAGQYFVRGTCEVGTRLVARLGLGPGTVRAIDQIFERWDGKGDPRGLKGEAIAPVARVVQATYLALCVHEIAGADAAIAELRRCAGSGLDPDVVDVVAKICAEMFAHFEETDPFIDAIDSEPRPIKMFASTHLREVALAFADMADLKTPHTAGHSRAVADLVTAAGARGPGSDLECAALMRDLGRVGIPNSIWSKPGPLTTSEWESVRLHAYHSERIISKVPALSSLAPLVGMHHERLDGSGYHRGSRGSDIPADARLLAVADAYHSMIEDRPYRPALKRDQAANALREEVTDGRLDAEAVGSVLASAGHEVQRTVARNPADLTEREVEVLRLLAFGKATKEIARALAIAPKTADNHIQKIYSKAGVSTRAAATLFAVENRILV